MFNKLLILIKQIVNNYKLTLQYQNQRIRGYRTNMRSTPIKKLERNNDSHQVTQLNQQSRALNYTNSQCSNFTRERTSQQIKSQYFQNKIVIKTKKIQELQDKNKYLTDKLCELQQLILGKQHQVCQKDARITDLMHRVSSLESELAVMVQQLHQQRRRLSQMQITDIKQKKQQDYNSKISKVMTKQNSSLISQNVQLKHLIAQQQEQLQQKQRVIQLEIKNNVLLNKLNQDLKLQVEQLLFEIKMMNRRDSVHKLNQYEDKIQRRLSYGFQTQKQKTQNKKKKTNQQNKENQPSNVRVNIQEKNLNMDVMDKNLSVQKQRMKEDVDNFEDRQQANKAQQEGRNELIELLKQKIHYLQQQLAISQKRCKQLQSIIIQK